MRKTILLSFILSLCLFGCGDDGGGNHPVLSSADQITAGGRIIPPADNCSATEGLTTIFWDHITGPVSGYKVVCKNEDTNIITTMDVGYLNEYPLCRILFEDGIYACAVKAYSKNSTFGESGYSDVILLERKDKAFWRR